MAGNPLLSYVSMVKDMQPQDIFGFYAIIGLIGIIITNFIHFSLSVLFLIVMLLLTFYALKEIEHIMIVKIVVSIGIALVTNFLAYLSIYEGYPFDTAVKFGKFAFWVVLVIMLVISVLYSDTQLNINAKNSDHPAKKA